MDEHDSEEYGLWKVCFNRFGASILHLHLGNEWRIHFAVNTENVCRECGETAPPGVVFRVKYLRVERSSTSKSR